MSARRRAVDADQDVRPADPIEFADRAEQAGRTGRGDRSGGPQSVEPWGTTGGEVDRDPPWGLGDDSPMDEGSEPTAVGPGRRGERRAAWAPGTGRHGFGNVEPTRVPEAGPGGDPEPEPPHRSYPNESSTGDLADNSLERQTGMRPRGASGSG